MWQRQRTPHSSLLLQSLEKLGVMHHSPSLSSLSLSVSSVVSPSIHLSIVLLSELRGYIILSSHMAHRSFLSPHNPPLLSVSIFHHNSLKGGISKSTNGRDLIGKSYRGGGAVHCLPWRLEERHPHDGVGRTDFAEQTADALPGGELLQKTSYCTYEMQPREVGEATERGFYWTP